VWHVLTNVVRFARPACGFPLAAIVAGQRRIGPVSNGDQYSVGFRHHNVTDKKILEFLFHRFIHRHDQWAVDNRLNLWITPDPGLISFLSVETVDPVLVDQKGPETA
jgi:hypothetical protein